MGGSGGLTAKHWFCKYAPPLLATYENYTYNFLNLSIITASLSVLKLVLSLHDRFLQNEFIDKALPNYRVSSTIVTIPITRDKTNFNTYNEALLDSCDR